MSCSLLVGADGIRSKVRQIIIGDKLNYLGHIVILGISPVQHHLIRRRLLFVLFIFAFFRVFCCFLLYALSLPFFLSFSFSLFIYPLSFLFLSPYLFVLYTSFFFLLIYLSFPLLIPFNSFINPL